MNKYTTISVPKEENQIENSIKCETVAERYKMLYCDFKIVIEIEKQIKPYSVHHQPLAVGGGT